MNDDTQFDVAAVPFSRFGSLMAISFLEPGQPNHAEGEIAGLYLRCIHGGGSASVFRIELGTDDDPQDFDIVARPSVLTLLPRGGRSTDPRDRSVEICFESADVLRVRAQNLAVRLVRDPNTSGGVVSGPEGRWRLSVGSLARRFMLETLAGGLAVEAPWRLVEGFGTKIHICPTVKALFTPEGPTGRLEFAIGAYESSPTGAERSLTFEQCRDATANAFGAWLARLPDVPVEYAKARVLSAYVNWSAVVAAEGNYATPAMLMSKNWMTRVYNWDNAFNAWGNSYANQAMAWDQFMLFFRHQHASGELADYINQGEVAFAYTKPPVHGWILRELMRNMALDRDRLAEVYGPLAAWTDWWLTCRDDDRDGVCQYDHGNDSGWDNASAFDVGQPVESPDLSAFLILQMDVLADIASKLGQAADAISWSSRADAMLGAFLEHSWRGDRFVAPRSGDHVVDPDADSLLLLIPIVLGQRLPQPIRDALIARLLAPGAYLTSHGLATERLQSPNYMAFGYWRGPIWGPSTLAIVAGLADAGEPELADEIARRFCNLCVRSGFAENFDAATGNPLCDPAYTWTASIFLILANRLLRSGFEGRDLLAGRVSFIDWPGRQQGRPIGSSGTPREVYP